MASTDPALFRAATEWFPAVPGPDDLSIWTLPGEQLKEGWRPKGTPLRTQDQVLATIMTIPNTRFETPDDSLFEFDERPGDSPQALKVWFYPGNNTGEEFIYSRYSYARANSYRQ